MVTGYKFSDEPKIAERLQRRCREEMKLRLLQDIRVDLAVCQLEGWPPLEYIDELLEMIEGLKHADNREKNQRTQTVPK